MDVALACLLGLLFLLVKETRQRGFISVGVDGHGMHYNVSLPPGPEMIGWANGQVNHAPALAAAA